MRHHLALAGRDEPLFADDATAQLHRASGGLPLALNNAVTAVIAADNKDLVDDACAKPRRRLRGTTPDSQGD